MVPSADSHSLRAMYGFLRRYYNTAFVIPAPLLFSILSTNFDHYTIQLLPPNVMGGSFGLSMAHTLV